MLLFDDQKFVVVQPIINAIIDFMHHAVIESNRPNRHYEKLNDDQVAESFGKKFHKSLKMYPIP